MTHMKKTKIVATIGPVSANEKTFTKMVTAGLNVARLNFSHGDHEEHARSLAIIRKVSKKTKIKVAVLQDLSGPKIRIGDFYQERVMLTAGEEFTLTTEKCVGDEHHASVNYPNLPKEIEKGKFILLDDGKKKLEVLEVKGKEIRCRIIFGGDTKGRRGVNLPGTALKISSLTAKDKKDLEFGVREQVDYMALSFVRRAEDVQELRAILEKKKSRARIIAKIETDQAIENLESILRAADGVMVARGDLAVEVPMEEVPILQKRIIQMARELGKPVIVATQMLESMIHAAVPTRAEVNDVANAILDGTDAIMLSEETTLGEYPVEAVAMMARIAGRVEQEGQEHMIVRNDSVGLDSVAESVGHAVVVTAKEVGAVAIVALTESGFTARSVARHRPEQPVVVLTPQDLAIGRVALVFGCTGYPVAPFTHTSQVIEIAKKILVREGFAKKGDRFIVAAGVPFGKKGGTNLLMVRTV
jgi:pyruvate kinase